MMYLPPLKQRIQKRTTNQEHRPPPQRRIGDEQPSVRRRKSSRVVLCTRRVNRVKKDIVSVAFTTRTKRISCCNSLGQPTTSPSRIWMGNLSQQTLGYPIQMCKKPDKSQTSRGASHIIHHACPFCHSTDRQ